MSNKCEKEIIKSEKVPQPIAPYSIGVKGCHFIFISGQLGMNPYTNTLVKGGIEAQTRQALLNLDEIINAAGSDISQVVKTTVFLKDINDFSAMNKVYAEFFNENPPARSAIQVAALPKEGLVEIEAIALKKEHCNCSE
jgi:2-iminobutanoate/2-iminopropanoate deaminase